MPPLALGLSRQSSMRLVAPILRSGVSSSVFPPGNVFRNTNLMESYLYPISAVSQTRSYSQKPGGFFARLFENIQNEFNKNKEMKDSLKKFREEAQKLEQSDSLREARRKFEAIEAETSKGSEAFRKTMEGIRDKIGEVAEEVQKTDIGKRAGEVSEKLAQGAKAAVGTVESFTKAEPVKKISESVKTVTKELEQNALNRVYKPPAKLRKRVEFSEMPEHSDPAAPKVVAPDDQSTGVQLHKDSKWFASWEDFKNNNAYVNKMFDLKMKYDESENPIVRASRAVTDKVSDIMGGLFSKTELSEVLTEILKVDPSFDKEAFLRECHDEIIPNLLEAMLKGDLEILRDWCYDGPYNVLSQPIKQAASMGYHFDSKVLDLSDVDLAAAKMMEQGPVLVITFQAQTIMTVKDKSGNVVEGDSNKVMRTTYVWVLCRDQTILDPKQAWRLIDLSANSVEQWI